MIHDLRYALRALRNRPTFTLVAVATLAPGIGVTAAVFTLANGLALRPLPGVINQDRVAIVESGAPNAGVSYPDLEDLPVRMSGLGDLLLQSCRHPPSSINVHQETPPSPWQLCGVSPCPAYE